MDSGCASQAMAEGTSTSGSAGPCAGAATHESAESGPPWVLLGDARMVVASRSLKSSLRNFWQEHSEGFTQMWTGLSFGERRNYLGASVDYLPGSRTDKPNGKAVEFGILLMPEVNVKDLASNGEGSLTALFKKWISSELEDDVQHTRLIAKNLLTTNKFFKPNPDEFVILADVEHCFKTGQVITWKEGFLRDILETFATKGVTLRTDIYELANTRVYMTLLDLAYWADDYTKNVLKLPSFLVASVLKGCASCGRIEREEEMELRHCRACVHPTVTLFCSKECQRAAYATHMPQCTGLSKARETRSSDACQVCGDLEWEGGGALRKCARCNGAQFKYCSRDCQATAWKAGHERECQGAAPLMHSIGRNRSTLTPRD